MQNVQCWGLKELGWEHCFRTHIFKCKYIHAYIKSLPYGLSVLPVSWHLGPLPLKFHKMVHTGVLVYSMESTHYSSLLCILVGTKNL